jgi:hypothetical protein
MDAAELEKALKGSNPAEPTNRVGRVSEA